ncbi:MAG TPA: hypothetical protein PLW66_05215, partial [Saprospiraceae bacterium]|nr:hypothetical protein [Saprospiraceae bacterium]
MTGPEKRECGVFLKSPYFNQRDDVVRLWEYLLEMPNRSAQEAFARCYPGEPFDDTRWRHVQSFLLARVENFLAQRSWEQNPVLAELHLAEAYRRRKEGKALDHVFRRAAGRLDKRPRDNE